ncbi:MAG: 50S ribosomal protein L15 [Gammaproteobacteria bacterium]|nr:50S ribosomal protein L15 [Gammaproteobacteria bacterium]
MRLNSIKPARGSRQTRKRIGRGMGSGIGKTGGRGHKGQKARSGGYHKVGFEGGQMPMQRRLPKFGFHSHLKRVSAEIRLDDLERAGAEVVDVKALKKANLVGKNIKRVKVFAAGKVGKPVRVKGLRVTRGSRAAIEKAGGVIED